jgi:hypothetical protein
MLNYELARVLIEERHRQVRRPAPSDRRPWRIARRRAGGGPGGDGSV